MCHPDRRRARARDALPSAVTAFVLLAVAAACAPEWSQTPSTTTAPSPLPSASSPDLPLPPVVPVTPPPPAPDPLSRPGPYIAAAAWSESPYGPSLRITPTPAGRSTDGRDDGDRAWAEVLGLRPEADLPTMRSQFLCHWVFARSLNPDKPSWNLEPWRPVVQEGAMVLAGCNPGGPEV